MQVIVAGHEALGKSYVRCYKQTYTHTHMHPLMCAQVERWEGGVEETWTPRRDLEGSTTLTTKLGKFGQPDPRCSSTRKPRTPTSTPRAPDLARYACSPCSSPQNKVVPGVAWGGGRGGGGSPGQCRLGLGSWRGGQGLGCKGGHTYTLLGGQGYLGT